MIWNRRGRAQAASRKPWIRDPLAVIPLSPQNLEQRRNSRGMVCLRLNVPVTGFRKLVADWLGYKYEKLVELDELGTRFYEQVDGRRTLRDIADALAGSCGRSREEMRQQAMLFTRDLMTRNMILLRVADENRPPDPRAGGGGGTEERAKRNSR